MNNTKAPTIYTSADDIGIVTLSSDEDENKKAYCTLTEKIPGGKWVVSRRVSHYSWDRWFIVSEADAVLWLASQT